jgi:hypothetical protein
LAEVAEAEFEGAERLAIRGVGEGVGHLLQEGAGRRLELSRMASAAFGAVVISWRGRRSVFG